MYLSFSSHLWDPDRRSVLYASYLSMLRSSFPLHLVECFAWTCAIVREFISCYLFLLCISRFQLFCAYKVIHRSSFNLIATLLAYYYYYYALYYYAFRYSLLKA
ncbi:hypothetical protein BJX65DRAFT_248464 [Aspergillus insuetus]